MISSLLGRFSPAISLLPNNFVFYKPRDGALRMSGSTGCLGYTWVVLRHFLHFFHEMGTFFQQNFCIFPSRWVSVLKKISVFVNQDGTHLQEIFCILFHKVGAIYT